MYHYTWVPSWALWSSFVCLLLSVNLRGDEEGHVSGLGPFIGLALGLTLASILGQIFPTMFLCYGWPFTLVAAATLRWRPRTWNLMLARIAILAPLALGLTTVGLRMGGVPFAVSQSCTMCKSNLKNLATALEMYREDKKALPESLQVLKPDYLKELPQCLGCEVPVKARVFFRHRQLELADGYGYRRVEDNYLLWCRSRGYVGHQQRQQPWYDSKEGLHDDSGSWSLPEGPEARAALEQGPPIPAF